MYRRGSCRFFYERIKKYTRGTRPADAVKVNIIDMDKNTLMDIVNEAEKTIRYNHLLDNQISKMLKVYENLIVN